MEHYDATIQPHNLSLVDRRRLDGLTAPEAVVLLDKEETRIMRHLLAVRAIRNTLAPAINRLPEEIMSIIMSIFKEDTIVDDLPSPHWQQIAHVCRWWRAVALQTASLWTYLNASNVDVTHAYLTRSGNAPLHISISSFVTTTTVREVVDLIVPHSRRIVNLDLSWFFFDTPNEMARLISQPLPILRKLKLVNMFPPGPDVLYIIPTVHERPSPMQDLELCMAYFPWSSTIFRGLRSLKLSYQYGNDATPPMDAFLEILNSCPQLETLALAFAGPTLGQVAAYPEPRRRINLGSIKEMKLSVMNGVDIAHLLAHIRIPKTAKLQIKCRPEDLTGDLSSIFPRDLSGLECLTSMREAVVICNTHLGVHTMDSTGNGQRGGIHVEQETSKEPNPEFTAGDFLVAIAPILGEIPLSLLTVMIDSERPYEEDWRDVLTRLPDLASLAFGYIKQRGDRYVDEDLLGALTGDQLSQPVCPGLVNLKVYTSAFDESFNTAVEGCLKSRVQSGATRLNSLEFTSMRWVGHGQASWPVVEEFVGVFEHSLEEDTH
ncbi:unnamed protein product [Somion occarium]|uniref:F-box domain-containing protein n=1 Tax=Somion occarium TaxID=3059160 RepID=A0ABP1EAN1_9APHY